MKKFKKILASLMLVLFANAVFGAPVLAPLSVQEQAASGATHVMVIKHSDLTETTTNTAETVTFTVAAKMGVELTHSVLKTPFTYSTTNGFASLAMTVGDGTDADLFLASQELNSHGTEVFLQFGRYTEIQPTVATATTNFIVATAIGGTVTTNEITYVTGVTAGAGYGRKLYTAGDTVDLVFTPTAAYSTSQLDAGEVWVYFRIWNAAK